MGRHSSPDDDEDDLVDALLAVGAGAAESSGASPDPVGRHAQPAAGDRPAPERAGTASLAHDLAGDRPEDAVPVVDASRTTAPSAAAPPAVAPPAVAPPADPRSGAAAREAAGPAAGPVVATDPAPGGQPAPAPAQNMASTHSTAADLALMRHHGDVRARCLAGLLVPFVVYVAALAVVGASRTSWALWVFAPLVVAGVLVGTFLDAGHKRYPDG